MLTIDMSIDKKTILLKAKSLRGLTLYFTIIQELLVKKKTPLFGKGGLGEI